ncbi:MAG: DHH family phosphoesterase [Myxococcota bacterium]
MRDVAPRPGHTAAFALQTRAFEAQRADAAFPPPPDVVDALLRARRVVTIGHTPPDGDCVGAALGLARGLSTLGRQAHAIVDADLPAGLRALGRRGDLHRGPPPFEPDLVVLVDVAQLDRIGSGASLIAKAPEVAVVDHHRVTATHAQLGLDPSVPLSTWIDDRYDAASLQVASLLEAMGGAANGWGHEWSRVAAPLAAGIATDTQWFRAPRTDARSLAVFKRLLDGEMSVLEDLEARLSPTLPPAATVMLDEDVCLTMVPCDGFTAAELTVPAEARERALAAARAIDGRMTIEDISGHLMDRLDRLVTHHGLSLLLQEEADNWVRVSIRSRSDDLAVEVAEHLGGGGKRGVAGATVRGRLQEVQGRIRQFLFEQIGASGHRVPASTSA